MSERHRRLQHVIAQLMAATATLRGMACSYDQNFVVVTTEMKSVSTCEEVCKALLNEVQNCHHVSEVNSCEYGESPPGAGEKPELYVICDVRMAYGGSSDGSCGAGRRPPGWHDVDDELIDDPTMHFTHAARLEAASVDAFLLLAAELDAHGAPPALSKQARRAARDEARHAAIMASLAGLAQPPRVASQPLALRSLETMAIDNAVEGCVREAIGGLVLALQAKRAPRRAMRRALSSVAHDELGHAALSLAIDEWTHARLDRAAARRVEEARALAAHGLVRELACARQPAWQRHIGLPSSDEQASIAQALSSRWA